MRRKEIERLQQVQGFPALTITLPTYRGTPEAQQNSIRLKNLTNQAQTLVREQCDNSAAGNALLERLHGVVAGLDSEEFQEGLAIFVHAKFAGAFPLPFTLPERVVLDDSFLTRDLVQARRRTVRYWALTLSDNSRLFAGTLERVTERKEGAFPVTFQDDYEDPSVPGARETKHASFMDERQRQFMRRVDDALTSALNEEELPVVLLGVTRNLAFFEEITENGEHIAGKAEGNYDHATNDKIAAVAWEALQPYLEQERADIVETWEAAIGAGLYVNGIEEAWQAAYDGRGDLLLVEEGYHASGRTDESGREITLVESGTLPEGTGMTQPNGSGPGALRADAVDDLIELVWARGGRVRFVPPETLSRGAGVGLTLRY